MRIWILLLVIVTLTVQILSRVSASADQHRDGLYYLSISGDPIEISRICAVGQCAQGFNSRTDALNAFVLWMGEAHGYVIAPLPLPPSP